MYIFRLLILLPSLALAATNNTPQSCTSVQFFFPISQNDSSYYILSMLFGNMSSSTGGGTGLLCTGAPMPLMQEVMTVLNMGALTLVGFIIMWTVVISVLQTAQQGAQMGKKISPFVILRTCLGSAFLVPTSTGYSAIQLIAMWIVLQGIGLADQIWTAALKTYQSQGGTYSNVSNASSPTNMEVALDSVIYPSGNTKAVNTNKLQVLTIDQITAALICTTAMYQYDLLTSSSTPVSTNYGYSFDKDCCWNNNQCPDGTTVPSNFNGVCFGKKDNSSNLSICGAYYAPFDYGYSDDTGRVVSAQAGKQCSSLNSGFSTSSACSAAYTALQSVILSLQSSVAANFSSAMTAQKANPTYTSESIACQGQSSVPAAASDTLNCQQTAWMSDAAESYVTELSPYNEEYVTQSDSSASSTSSFDQMITDAENSGWLLAGMYYTSMYANQTQTIPPSGGTNATLTNNMLFTNNIIPAGATSTSAPAYGFKYPGQSTISSNVVIQTYNFYKCGTTQCTGSSTSSCSYANQGTCFSSSMPLYFTGNTSQSTSPNSICSQENCYARGSLYSQEEEASSVTTSSGNICPSETAMENQGLSTATALQNLYSYWLTFDSDSSLYSSWDLEEISIWAAGLQGVQDYQQIYSVAIPQDNLYVTINKTMSEIMGLNYFSPSASAVGQYFWDVKDQVNTGAWNNACSGKTAAQCYVNACTAGLIDMPHGMFGMLNASITGQAYDPMAQMRYMGLNLLRYGFDYFNELIPDMIDAVTNLATLYAGVAIAVASSISIIVSAAILVSAEAPGVGVVVSGIGQLFNSTYQSISQIYYQIDNTKLNLWQGIASSFAGLAIMLGFYLGVYLANIPSITYVFAGIGYFILVIEAMIAAPLVAMAIAHPEGHDILGKAEASVLLFLSIFLRPSGMVFGLIFSIQLLLPAFSLLNYVFTSLIGDFFSFFATMSSTSSDYNAGSVIPLISGTGVTFLYAYMAVTVTTNIFGQIYTIPDKLMRWIGGQMEQSSVSQMVAEVKQQVGAAAEKGTQGAGQSAAGAGRQVSVGGIQAASMVKGEKESAGVSGSADGGAEGGTGSGAGTGGGGGE